MPQLEQPKTIHFFISYPLTPQWPIWFYLFEPTILRLRRENPPISVASWIEAACVKLLGLVSLILARLTGGYTVKGNGFAA